MIRYGLAGATILGMAYLVTWLAGTYASIIHAFVQGIMP